MKPGPDYERLVAEAIRQLAGWALVGLGMLAVLAAISLSL